MVLKMVKSERKLVSRYFTIALASLLLGCLNLSNHGFENILSVHGIYIVTLISLSWIFAFGLMISSSLRYKVDNHDYIMALVWLIYMVLINLT